MSKVTRFIKKFGMTAAIVGGSILSARADAPTSLDGFSTVGEGYITTATSVAIAAATLGLGWVGYRLVKRFTSGAK